MCVSPPVCPACGDAHARPLIDVTSALLGVLTRVPRSNDRLLERQLTDAIERCHQELAIAQHITQEDHQP
jgi:hypothetical protein